MLRLNVVQELKTLFNIIPERGSGGFKGWIKMNFKRHSVIEDL